MLPRSLGLWLYHSSQLEGYAAGIALRLARGTLVTAEERDYVGDVIFKQELEHRDLLRGFATSIVQPPRPLAVPNIWDASELQMLMLLTRGEGALLLEEQKFQRIFSVTGRRDLIDGYAKIVDDERGHRAWSRRVVARLHEEGARVPIQVMRSFGAFHPVRALVADICQELGIAPQC